MNAPLHVAFCGGGSGGHITPALSVAEALVQLCHECNQPLAGLQFFTSSRPVDQEMLHSLWSIHRATQHVPLPVSTSQGKVGYACRVLRCTALCLYHFLKQRPDVIVSTGGFAALPGIIAARLLQIPILFIEPNSVSGRVHRRTSRWAALACLGWRSEDAGQAGWQCPTLATGVPIRPAAPARDTKPQCDDDQKERLILILGGSLGAQRLNEIAATAVTEEAEQLVGLKIIHQTGLRDAQSLTQRYAEQPLAVDVQPFVDDLQPLLQQAAIVVTRAGAVTLAECCRAGSALILLPLSTSADDHQAANASVLQSRNAAIVIDESRADAARHLRAGLVTMLNDEEQRTQLSRAAAKAFDPRAALTIAEKVFSLAGKL